MTYSSKKSFALVFSVEFWERWAYYGMQALLALYFVQKMGYTDTKAYAIFAAFSALMYLFPSLGGIIADKFIGPKSTLAMGAGILVTGYACLCFNLTNEIFTPLALIVVGGGIFKPNPSRLIEMIYRAEPNKLSSAFTIFYMSVNIGSLFSISITPIVAKYYGFNMAFGISFIGMTIALLNYILMLRLLKDLTVTITKPLNFERIYMFITFVIGGVIASFYLIKYYQACSYAILGGAVVILFYALVEGLQISKQEQKKLLVAVILIFQAIVFFIIYFQMPTTMTPAKTRRENFLFPFFLLSTGRLCSTLSSFWSA